MTAGYTFTAMSDAPSVSMDATVSGGFRFGFQYTRKDGYHWVHDHSFNPKGSLPHASEWDLQLAGQVGGVLGQPPATPPVCGPTTYCIVLRCGRAQLVMMLRGSDCHDERSLLLTIAHPT